MKILALEFSPPQRSVAVVQLLAPAVSASEIVDEGPESGGALAAVEEVLRRAGVEREQIECVAVGLGPGSYHGIRAALALAQGWQLASGARLIGISSAEGAAAQAEAEGVTGKIQVVIDAQRNEFYLAGYEITAEGLQEREPLRLATLAEARDCERRGELLVGPEVTRWFPDGRIVFPHAATVGRLAMARVDSDFVAGEKWEPIYLRETTFVKAPPRKTAV